MIPFLIRLSRPRFALYEFGTFWIGIFAGLSSFAGLTNPLVWVFAVYFLFPANLLIYGVNDMYDYETDRLNPKKQGYEDLLIPEKHPFVRRAILWCNVPFLLFLPFVPSLAGIALLLFWFFAIFYSAPPIRAKAHPFFDSFFSAGHYTATGVFGYFLVSSFSHANWEVICAALSWCMAMHAYSAIPDISSDAEAGLKTIATNLGHRNTLYLCIILYGLAGVLSSIVLGWMSVVLVVVYMFFMVLSYRLSDVDLLKLYRIFPWLNAIVGAIITFRLLSLIPFSNVLAFFA